MTQDERLQIVKAELMHRQADVELLDGCGALAIENERVHSAMTLVRKGLMESGRVAGRSTTTPQEALNARLRYERAHADFMLAIVTAARVVLQEAVAHRMREWPAQTAGGDA